MLDPLDCPPDRICSGHRYSLISDDDEAGRAIDYRFLLAAKGRIPWGAKQPRKFAISTFRGNGRLREPSRVGGVTVLLHQGSTSHRDAGRVLVRSWISRTVSFRPVIVAGSISRSSKPLLASEVFPLNELDFATPRHR